MPRLRDTDDFLNEWKSLWKPDLDALGGYNGATCDPTRVDPKVVEWAKQNCGLKPHFIKIINNNAANGASGQCKWPASKTPRKLTVPTPFVKEHFRELKRVVTLENEDGKKWKVSFGEIRTHPSWQQGWRRFAGDHDLKSGEVVVFLLIGNSHFHFTRFDEDGNILSEKSARSPLNGVGGLKRKLATTLSDSQSHDKPGSVTNPEAGSHRILAATEIKRGTQPSGVGFRGHGHEASHSLAPADKQIAEAPLRGRRLCKVGEIKSKANSNNDLNLAINNEQLHDSEEAGSNSMVDSPSTIRVVTSQHRNT